MSLFFILIFDVVISLCVENDGSLKPIKASHMAILARENQIGGAHLLLAGCGFEMWRYKKEKACVQR